MIFALVIVCLGAPVVFGMRWLNLKVAAADKDKRKKMVRLNSQTAGSTDGAEKSTNNSSEMADTV